MAVPTERQSEGYVVWLTGLPCAGKSTLASGLAERLAAQGLACEVLDGDVIRRHLSQGLSFSREDRDTNVRRIGFVASLLARNGVPVIVAAVSPYRSTRDEVRREIPNFLEVYVRCPSEICERRDVKGMYAQARAGKIAHFTGVDDPYEAPTSSEVTIATDQEPVSESLNRIVQALEARGWLAPASKT